MVGNRPVRHCHCCGSGCSASAGYAPLDARTEPLIAKHAYQFRPVYRLIAGRLRVRYGLEIDHHVSSMQKVGARSGEGIFFFPKDHVALRSALKPPAFGRDDLERFCDAAPDLPGRLQGFREAGAPSLHCRIAAGLCNIHLDTYGFVVIDPDGVKHHEPALVQRVVDVLDWEQVVRLLGSVDPSLARLAGSTRPVPAGRAPASGGAVAVESGRGFRLAVERSVEARGEKRMVNRLGIVDV